MFIKGKPSLWLLMIGWFCLDIGLFSGPVYGKDLDPQKRLDQCPFKEGKTSCAKCPIHCYRPDMREEIRTVMRYAGPRMTYLHPVKALFHMIDGLRKEPKKSKTK